MHVGVIFGGQSPEHDVSLVSAQAVIERIDRTQYDVLPIKIRKDGKWERSAQKGSSTKESVSQNFPYALHALAQQVDIFFPLLHGPWGEDGTLQGALEFARLPYVGADHMSSAICMDKAIAKGLLRGAGIPTPRAHLY